MSLVAQQHRPGPGPGRQRRPLLPGAGAGRRLGPRPRAAARGRRPACRCRASSALYIAAEVCRALAYAHGEDATATAAGHRPPRRQPAQRPAVRSGRGEADRLRHRQGDEQARADRHRRGEGQGRVHVARAGDGQADRRALRPLLAGHDALPVGDARAARSRGRPTSRRCCACRRATSAARGGRARSGARGRRDHRPGDAAGPGRALPERRRDAGRRRARAAHGVPAGRPDRAQALAAPSCPRTTACRSIGKAPERAAVAHAAAGTGELDGKDVVLLDSQSSTTKRSSTARRRRRWRSSKAAAGRAHAAVAPRAADRSRRCPCRATPRPNWRGAPARSSRCRSPRPRSGPGAARERGGGVFKSSSRRCCWWPAPGSAASTTGRTCGDWRSRDRGRRGRGKTERRATNRRPRPTKTEPPARGRPRPSRRPEADAGAAGHAEAAQPAGERRRRAGRACAKAERSRPPAAVAAQPPPRRRKRQRRATLARPRPQEHDGARSRRCCRRRRAPRAAPPPPRPSAPRPRALASGQPREADASRTESEARTAGLSAERPDGGVTIRAAPAPAFSFSPEPCRLGQQVGTVQRRKHDETVVTVVGVWQRLGDVALAGCGPRERSGFAGSTPTAENVALDVPAGGSDASARSPATACAGSALLGDEARSYKLTAP